MEPGRTVEYTRPMVLALLRFWPELDCVEESELLVVMRCDLTLRWQRIAPKHRTVLATMMLVGDGAVESEAVTEGELKASVSALLRVLNIEGLK